MHQCSPYHNHIRRQLAEYFPGAFLLRKRCRCRLLTFGHGPMAEIVAEPCPRCRRYADYLWKQKRPSLLHHASTKRGAA